MRGRVQSAATDAQKHIEFLYVKTQPLEELEGRVERAQPTQRISATRRSYEFSVDWMGVSSFGLVESESEPQFELGFRAGLVEAGSPSEPITDEMSARVLGSQYRLACSDVKTSLSL